jgi:phosphoglycerate dehydrogenase-like enzyme
LKALKEGYLAGAGLDVIDGEWLSREELLKHPLIQFAQEHSNLIIVPHIAGATCESIYGARLFMTNKIAKFILSNE